MSGTFPNGTLYVDYNFNGGSAQGSYALSGTGVLSATREYIGFSVGGGEAVFNQSGGTNRTSMLVINEGNPDSYGSYILTGGTLTVTGGINILGSLSGEGFFSIGGGTATAGDVRNGGIVDIAGPAGSNSYGNLTVNGSYAQGGGLTQVDGLLTIATGSSLALSGGTLSGTGTIAGDVVNTGGIVSPGDAPEPLNISGNFTQGSAGTLNINIAGDANTLDFASLLVGETANLDGTLDITFINGFTPFFGEAFDFLTAGDGVSGQFAEVDSPYTLAINYSPDGLSLTVVPEPSGIGLLAIGAGLLLRRKRGRSIEPPRHRGRREDGSRG